MILAHIYVCNNCLYSFQLAEKRKGLLDELAIKYQQESSEHHEQIKSLTRQHASKVEELNAQIDQLQVRSFLLISIG